MSFIETECGLKCRSKQHASELNAAITKGSSEEVKAFLQTCHATGEQSDLDGNFPLHVAASCGKLDVVQWLLDEKHVDVNAVDRESGWTALHKALFYGQLHIARLLIKHQAHLEVQDHEGLQPFNLQKEDELIKKSYIHEAPNEVYLWGDNHNSTLGLSTEQKRTFPTPVDTFQQQHISIKQVILCKYHTVFLSHCGLVYTCGHGRGGRLGLGDEKTYLTPQLVKSLKGEKYLAIAASVNHTVMVTTRGNVYSCGLNEHFQLGQNPIPTTCLIPKPIFMKTFTGISVIGACTGQYHTVVYTHRSIYTVGFNGGQLGQLKGEHYQKQLHLMLALSESDQHINCVESSDAASVCLSSNGDIYVFHEFRCRKIISNFVAAEGIALTGGNLNLEGLNLSTSSSKTNKMSSSGKDSQLVIVIFCGRHRRACIWRSFSPTLKYCLFDISDFNVMDICLSECYIGIVTTKGEAYIGNWTDSQKTSKEKPPLKETWAPFKDSSQWKVMNDEIISMKRLPYIHRATCLTMSHNGKNFAVTQADPFVSLKHYTDKKSPRTVSCFRELLDTSDMMSPIHDVQIKSGYQLWSAHRYILAFNSEYFRDLILTDSPQQMDGIQLVLIPYIHPDLVKQLLQFVYTFNCDLLMVGKQFVWSTPPHTHLNQWQVSKDNETERAASSSDPIALLLQLAEKFELNELVERLDYVCLRKDKVQLKTRKRKVPFSEPKFDRSALPVLTDITIKSSDKGEQFKCHKCILVARSDYFNSMLSCGWRETSTSTLTLPFPADVLDVFLHYLYTNDIPPLKDFNLLCNILAMADQTLVFDLKNLCEFQIIETINMKNISELLEFASIYRAETLLKTCLQGICDNITFFLELRLLDFVEEETMREITKFYKTSLKCMERRMITPFSDGPDKQYLEQLAKISNSSSSSSSKQVNNPKVQATPVIKNKIGKRRSRHKSSSFSESKNPEAVLNDRSQLHDSLVNDNNNNNNNNNNKYDKNQPEQMKNEADSLNQSFTESTSCQKPVAVRNKDNPWSLILSPVQVPAKSRTSPTRTLQPVPQSVISLTNIMAEQQQNQSQKQKEVKSWCQTLKTAKSGSHDTMKNTISWGLASCRKQKLSEGSNTAEATSPTSPPPPVTSPWQIKTDKATSDAHNHCKLADIVKDEMEKSKLLSRTRKKSLHYIQIEEKAITELLAFYKAQVSFDEVISVEREYVSIEQPLWNVNRKLRYNETLLSSPSNS